MRFVATFVSQPLYGLASQSAYPVLHGPMPQIPKLHAGTAFGRLHLYPHEPQFCASVGVETSQPSPTLPLQSANPGLH